MKKKISFDKKIDFPTMIGEISSISLEQDLRFVDESNVEGNLLLTGKYKLTEASRLEEDFNYKIPVEISFSEKLDLNSTNIDISDFSYDIEDGEVMNCHVELKIDGLEIIDTLDDKERECDSDDETKEIEIPKIENTEINNNNNIEEDDLNMKDSNLEIVEKEVSNEDSLFFQFNDNTETYGTFLVYIIRQNETVNSIIEKYNTTLEELEKYNDLTNLNIGTKLIIPLIKNEE